MFIQGRVYTLRFNCTFYVYCAIAHTCICCNCMERCIPVCIVRNMPSDSKVYVYTLHVHCAAELCIRIYFIISLLIVVV